MYLGSGGQGIAPLVGAAVTVVKNDAGQITGVGIGLQMFMDLDIVEPYQ